MTTKLGVHEVVENNYLVTKRTHQILHRLAVVFPEFAQIFDEDPVKPRMPVVANDTEGVCLQVNQVWISRISAHDLKSVRGIREEG